MQVLRTSLAISKTRNTRMMPPSCTLQSMVQHGMSVSVWSYNSLIIYIVRAVLSGWQYGSFLSLLHTCNIHQDIPLYGSKLTNSSLETMCFRAWDCMFQSLRLCVSELETMCFRAWDYVFQSLRLCVSEPETVCFRAWDCVFQSLRLCVSEPETLCLKTWNNKCHSLILIRINPIWIGT